MRSEPRSVSPLAGREREELLALLLREEGFALEDGIPIPSGENPSGDGVGPRPLSAAQERLWLLTRLYPSTPAYNLPAAVRLRGPLDVPALEWGLTEVITRHDALRTAIRDEDGRPTQVTLPPTPHQLRLDDLGDVPAPEQGALVERIAVEQARQPFDLGAGSLVRTRLLRLGSQEHVFLVTMHHIVSDGWSLGVFVREMMACYNAYRSQTPSPLPPLPVRFADVASWHGRSDRIDRDLAYWRRQLDAVPAMLTVPEDHPRPPAPSFSGARVPFALDAELTAALRRLAHVEGGTLFVALFAGLATLLYRYTGAEDVVIGTPVANRDRRELEDLIGFFVNTVVLRLNLAGNPTGRELLHRAGAVALEAWEHQRVPFVTLVSELNPGREPSRSPLFQLMLALQNAPLPAPKLDGLDVQPMPVSTGTAKFDITIELAEDERGLVGFIEYSTDLFEPATITRMAAHLRILLAGMVAEPEQRVGDLPLLTAAEQRSMGDWNATSTSLGSDACLHELFEGQARRSPDAVALRWCGESVSYEQLRRRVHRLARRLRRLGVGPEVLVGVCLDRSPDLIVAELAVLQAGGAFVPLEPAHPAEWLRFIIDDAGLSVVVTRESFREPFTRPDVAVLTTDGPEVDDLDGPDVDDPGRACTPDSLAYVIYTSGSSGRPKGAMNCHRGVVNRLRWMQHAYRLTGADRVLQKAPFSFDVSVWELFWPLLVGATMVMCEPGRQSDAAYLAALIEVEDVTTVHFVPSMLRQFLTEPTVDRCRTLRLVVCSGEALSHSLQEQFFARFEVALENLYGPTEAAIDVTRWSCRPGPPPVVPIGRPIANVTAYVLDRWLVPLPVSMPGELYLGGVAVGRGYVNRPGLTAERYLPDPFSRRPGARMYRTGDRARWRPDGSIEYLGRLDDQLKIRGFRIEPGEIEAALSRHPGIRACAVAAREGDGDPRLVAYVVPRGTPPSASQLRGFLKEHIPDHLLPTHVVSLDTLPVTHNGKLDRRALPAPGHARPALDTALVEPQDDIESALAAIWREVLQVERVGVNDNFFDLGGHSLLLARAHARVLEQFDATVTLMDMFRFPTIATLAQRLADPTGAAPGGPTGASVHATRWATGAARLRQRRERRHSPAGESGASMSGEGGSHDA